MTLLKPLNIPSMLIPYEQFYIQTLHQVDKLIPGQYPGELNPLFQTFANSGTIARRTKSPISDGH